MAFKTNYRQQRSERARAQSLRKDEKLQKRQEKRKSEQDEPAPPDAAPMDQTDPAPETTSGDPAA